MTKELTEAVKEMGKTVIRVLDQQERILALMEERNKELQELKDKVDKFSRS